jgi:hypothetical protein
VTAVCVTQYNLVSALVWKPGQTPQNATETTVRSHDDMDWAMINVQGACACMRLMSVDNSSTQHVKNMLKPNLVDLLSRMSNVK